MINKYSIVSLLKKFEIHIPAIQREYVQGYNETKSNLVREKLIDDIFQILESDKNDNNLNLNIIYGYIEKSNDGKNKDILYPVDGQQRLTTLYLIHWYLWIFMDNEIDINVSALRYEIRESLYSFFDKLIYEKVFFREILTNKCIDSVGLFEKIIEQTWFEQEWLLDNTILAVINVISEIKKRNINLEKVNDYYRLLDNVFFHFVGMDDTLDSARKKSAIEYSKINARGKQLELFENIKAKLSILEKSISIKEGNGYVYNYDRRYIDYFYNQCKSFGDESNLEKITKLMNETSLVLLINSYKLLNLLNGNNKVIEEDNNNIWFYKVINDYNDYKNNNFWEKYIVFLNNILESIIETNNEKVLNDIFNEFCKNKINFNGYKDQKQVISILLYFNEYKINNNKVMSSEVINKFIYVLNNLGYSEWKEHKFDYINGFIKVTSRYKDIFKYFVVTSLNDLKLNIKSNNISIDSMDIEIRLKEQKIKAEIIHDNNIEEYNWFDKLESVFSKKRSIYFLLRFSGYWDDSYNSSTKGDFKKLKKYMKVADKWYKSKIDIELRKYFAFMTYFDIKNNRLLSSSTINNLESNYIKSYQDLKGIVHLFYEHYYFLEDKLENKEINKRKISLSILQSLYDFIDNCNIGNKNYDCDERVKTYLNDLSYDNCWLKYAVYRDYENLLIRELIKSNDQIYLKKLKEDNFARYDKINFFAFVYYIDEKNKEKNKVWKCNNYESYVYDLYTRNVRDTKYQSDYLEYEEKNNILNMFQLKLIWQNQVELGWLGYRNFFYYIYTLNLIGDENTIFIIEGDIIKKINFDCNYSYYIETIFNFNIVKEILNNFLKLEYDNIEKLKEIQSKAFRLNHKYNYLSGLKKDEEQMYKEEQDKLLIESENFINSNYKCKKKYDYNSIRKYLSNTSRNLDEILIKCFHMETSTKSLKLQGRSEIKYTT